MLHIGQYLLVCKYFTIQLLQTVEEKKKEIFSSHYADNRQFNSACEMALRLLAANDIRINDHLALLTLTGV